MSYQIFLSVHIVSFVAWMAAQLYLPRLFVYHSGVAVGSEASELFKVMEGRLYRYIMTPALIATWLSGLALVILGAHYASGWLHIKFLFVLLLSGFHGVLGGRRRQFAQDTRKYSARHYRIMNEVPTVLLIAIVIVAIFKPFS